MNKLLINILKCIVLTHSLFLLQLEQKFETNVTKVPPAFQIEVN